MKMMLMRSLIHKKSRAKQHSHQPQPPIHSFLNPSQQHDDDDEDEEEASESQIVPINMAYTAGERKMDEGREREREE